MPSAASGSKSAGLGPDPPKPGAQVDPSSSGIGSYRSLLQDRKPTDTPLLESGLGSVETQVLAPPSAAAVIDCTVGEVEKIALGTANCRMFSC